jgi:glycerol-3-phosphate dehydrogenase (NAD(P)+)
VTTIGILGAGAWGTALALVAASAGCDVVLWARDSEQAADMASRRENRRRLPGVALPDAISVTAETARAVACETILVAVPAQTLRDTLRAAASLSAERKTLVICAKGIERASGRLPSEIVAQEWPQAAVAILSGPSFASDVARQRPTAVTLAAADAPAAERLCALVGTRSFRPYASTDIRGVEIGGAGKNVLAIACGIAAGLDLGASANAALTARGFAELRRFGHAYGARPETLMGLSGLGDLLLTCGSIQSRNFALGHAIGHGEPVNAALGHALAEGAYTAPVLVDLARERGIEMPIAAAVAAVLDGSLDVGRAVDTLLTRPFRTEE